MGSSIAGSSTLDAGSGAGNVIVQIPEGVAATIHAVSGLGTVNIDSHFSRIDHDTYRSPDYESAANRIEITAHSGAGNVSVNTK
jgi:predicted membrane protein